MQKICTICTNEICKIYVLYASIYKNMQIPNMHLYANIHMHIYAKICRNMQNWICINMHFYNMHNMLNIYLDMHYIICQNMHKHECAEICKKKCLNMQKNMQIYAFASWVYLNCIYMPKYAKNLHKYAKCESMNIICIICASHFADERQTFAWGPSIGE